MIILVQTNFIKTTIIRQNIFKQITLRNVKLEYRTSRSGHTTI